MQMLTVISQSFHIVKQVFPKAALNAGIPPWLKSTEKRQILLNEVSAFHSSLLLFVISLLA